MSGSACWSACVRDVSLYYCAGVHRVQLQAHDGPKTGVAGSAAPGGASTQVGHRNAVGLHRHGVSLTSHSHRQLRNGKVGFAGPKQFKPPQCPNTRLCLETET